MNLVEFAAEFWPHDGVAKGVAIQLHQSSQLMPLLRVQKMEGLVHKFSREESGGQITRRTINLPFPTTARGVLTPDEEKIEIAGAHVETDHRLESATDGKARANEINRRTRTLGRYIDKQLIKGDGQADPTQITGLLDRIPVGQTIEAGDDGAPITMALFEELIDKVEDQGAGRFALAPARVCRSLKRAIVASAGGASLTEVANGIMDYEGVKIIPAGRDEAGNWLMDYDETQGSSDVSASMLCIAPGIEDDMGVNLLMASNSIEVVAEGVREGMYHDQIEVAFGVCVFTKRSIGRLKGIILPAA